MDNHCVMCGSYLADTGRMVCEKCEKPEQLVLYDVPPAPPKKDDKQKKSWEDGFQRWSNSMFDVEGSHPLGCCGYGSMCDYCEDNSYGRPCVRALNEMCRKERITIDYSKRNYEDIWNGVF